MELRVTFGDIEVTLSPRAAELLKEKPNLGIPELVVEVALERLVRDLQEPKQALAILDEIDDLERLRKMRLPEVRELEESQPEEP